MGHPTTYFISKHSNLKQLFPWKMGAKGQISLMQFLKGDRPMAQLRCSRICLPRSCNFTSTLSTLTRFSSILLAPSGALIAIPTYYYSLVEILKLMLNRDSEIVICSRVVNCELWSCAVNSTLGSVVPSAMFCFFIGPKSDHCLPLSLTQWLTDV